MGTLKQAVQTRLAKSGYAIIRTEPRKRSETILYTEAELAKLDADIQALRLNSDDYEIWTSPAAVKEYLKKERINSYHQTVAACTNLGVELANKRVLDVGTCSGYLLRIIDEGFPGCTLTGTDYYEECVRLSAGLVPKATVFQASIDDLAAKTDTYDVIFCTEVLEHILDTETPILKLMGLVNPAGALVITVPNGTYDFTPSFTSSDGTSFVGHVNFWTPHSWKFYIERVAASFRTETGTVGNNFDDDVLFAVIFKD